MPVAKQRDPRAELKELAKEFAAVRRVRRDHGRSLRGILSSARIDAKAVAKLADSSAKHNAATGRLLELIDKYAFTHRQAHGDAPVRLPPAMAAELRTLKTRPRVQVSTTNLKLIRALNAHNEALYRLFDRASTIMVSHGLTIGEERRRRLAA